MKPIKSILVASDFSKESDNALAFALKLAKKTSAKIDMLHVVSPLQEFRFPRVKEHDNTINRKLMEHAGNRLETLHESIDETYRGSCVIKSERRASDAIIKRTKEKKGGYDLVLMGCRGDHKTITSRGDTAVRVIRQSEAPVLTISPDLSDSYLNRIVVPTDGSELSLKALPYAIYLASLFEATITLLNVVHMHGNFMAYHTTLVDEFDTRKVYNALVTRVEDYLEATDKSITLKRTGKDFKDQFIIGTGDLNATIPVFTVIKSGYSVHYEITEFAEDIADLVVIATHGYSALKQMMLGSNAEKVVRNLNKSVLTIRPAAKDFDKAVSGRNKLVSWDPL